MEPIFQAPVRDDQVVVHSYLRRGRRALAGRRRPRRPDAAVQGAAAQALLRRPRRRAVRPHLRAARVLPDAHRAGDPRGARRRTSWRAPARASSSSSGRARRPRRACCCSAMRDAGALRPLRPVDVTESMVVDTAAALVEEYPGLRVHGIVGDFERHLGPRPARRRPAAARVPRRDDRQLHAGQPAALPARARAAAGPRRPPAARHRPRQGPGGHRGRLRRRRGRHRRVQPQRPARGQPRAATPTSTSASFEHVAFFDRDHEWIEMRLRSAGEAAVHDRGARPRRRASTPARRCAPRSARSSRASGCAGDLAAAGLELVEVLHRPRRTSSRCRLSRPQHRVPPHEHRKQRGARRRRRLGAGRGHRPAPPRGRRDGHDRRRQRREGRGAGRASWASASWRATCARRSRCRPRSTPPSRPDGGLRISDLLRGDRLGAEGGRLQGPARADALRDDPRDQPDRHFNVLRLAATAMLAGEPDEEGERGVLRQHRVDRGVRRADRPDRLLGLEGRRRRDDASRRARPGPERHPRRDDRPGPVRHPAARRAARGRAQRARRAACRSPSDSAAPPSTPSSPPTSSRTRCSTARRSGSTGRCAWPRGDRAALPRRPLVPVRRAGADQHDGRRGDDLRGRPGHAPRARARAHREPPAPRPQVPPEGRVPGPGDHQPGLGRRPVLRPALARPPRRPARHPAPRISSPRSSGPRCRASSTARARCGS